MNSEKLKALRKLKADLMLQVNALESAISILERMGDDADFENVEKPKSVKKGKARNTEFESSIDLTKIPDYNPRGGGIRNDI